MAHVSHPSLLQALQVSIASAVAGDKIYRGGATAMPGADDDIAGKFLRAAMRWACQPINEFMQEIRSCRRELLLLR